MQQLNFFGILSYRKYMMRLNLRANWSFQLKVCFYFVSQTYGYYDDYPKFTPKDYNNWPVSVEDPGKALRLASTVVKGIKSKINKNKRTLFLFNIKKISV